MILQTTDKLEAKIGNKYSLVIVSAKRARQLKEGYSALSRDTSPHPLSIAIREIEEDKLSAIAPPEEEIMPAPRDLIASLIAGSDFDLDEDLDLDDSDAVDDLAALLVGGDDEDEEEEADPVSDLLSPTAVVADDEDEDENADTEETSLDDAEDEDEDTDE